MIALLIHTAATLAMVGLIWQVQLVHYPLFALASRERFPSFAEQHQRRISWVVIPLMLAELGSALWLTVMPAPSLAGADLDAQRWAMLCWVGLALLAAIWVSTALMQVPLHQRLTGGFDADAVRRLVATNWVRTVCWTARGGIALALLEIHSRRG